MINLLKKLFIRISGILKAIINLLITYYLFKKGAK
jgi:hypothetical protein